MKKTYINPTMQVFTIQTAGMLAQSKFDSEKGSQGVTPGGNYDGKFHSPRRGSSWDDEYEDEEEEW